MVFAHTHAAADFDWSSGGDGGSGNFIIETEQQELVVVGEIPVGLSGIEISLASTDDVDIQLYDKATDTAIIAWPDGILNRPAMQRAEYEGVAIEYSGYNGDQTLNGRGNEYIKILDTTNRPLIIKALGYTAGSAAVNYTWIGGGESIRIAQLEALLAQVTAERDARPTLAEVQDARAGSIVLVADRENNEVTLSFKVEETENLKQGTWRTVQGGDISLKVALDPGNKFMRIALGE
ncbi:MAG: hypothetical protein GY899_12825 [Verrucomicrobiaceae bacterium]|nr:hypothetical protein [Verrucomicrobiaceae bacterium]